VIAKEAPQTVACTSTMNWLEELVNLHIYVGFMFCSVLLQCPWPSWPNWLQPMLKAAPKVLTIRQ
jgi:hypothetical protein